MKSQDRRLASFLICALFAWNGACAQVASSSQNDVDHPKLPTKCDANEWATAIEGIARIQTCPARARCSCAEVTRLPGVTQEAAE